MNTARPTKATFVAALLLGALMALLATTPARTAEPFRLDRVGIVRFTPGEEGKVQRQTGILHRDGRMAARFTIEIARPANTPAWALDRALISVDAWHHYRALGTDALSNFKLLGGGANFSIGEERFEIPAASTPAIPAQCD